METIIKFYLSGFYKKPKGLKKPYNPILGETFRCKWEHPDNSTSYYVAEQVSHHPPVSALFLTNRKAGFNISGTILAKSKYYGNSLSAMMIGDVRITLLQLGETYIATLPYASCKGIMFGTLSMEYGGKVRIECNRTDYVCELDFKLKPFIGGMANLIAGDIKCKKELVAHIEGAWDGEIYISEKININLLKHRHWSNEIAPKMKCHCNQYVDINSHRVYSKIGILQDVKTLLWSPTPDVIAKRLKRYEILLEEQDEWESKKLWLKVSEAITNDDQKAATEEKSKLENEQRARIKSEVRHKPKWFKQDLLSKNYEYIHADYQAWDENNDIRQIEHGYVIRTKTKHGTKGRSASPSSSSVQQGQSEDSDLPGGDTLDHAVQLLRRLETNFENRTSVAVTKRQLIVIMDLSPNILRYLRSISRVSGGSEDRYPLD
ncbi:unnamed protein product [Litomosoides sigmodontis]|uniref:Oxysterol-binding protein n=1 Tax=Litomosoides sigmodontis TaxID=42156 RepID=A0A3P6T733_LITSI|nr:unnamed protein product [Litomosoides sigmodontis]VDK79080.1 unnamed protein product [Litomosoides sigmodontis]